VRIEHLAASFFRNLERFELTLDHRVILVRGNNGQGKTNLLEALYLCATGRSFRHALPGELVRFGASAAEVRATIQRQDVRHQVRAVMTAHRRSLHVDDRHVAHMSTLLGLINVVAFFPDDLRIVKAGAEERRRFLDRAVANYQPTFVDASLQYARALRSRNAVLRAETRPDPALIVAFDEVLVRYGTVMDAHRQEAVRALTPLAAREVAQILPDVGGLQLVLSSGVPSSSGEDFASAFARLLHERLPRDRARGMTSVGPHRADLVLSLGEHPARLFASQGQQRTLVLALKLGEVALLAERLGAPPILLLDDVSSELDQERTRLLFSTLAHSGSQVWVSTTGNAVLPIGDDVKIIEVEAGRLR
jgi:DNA replication and repair protein RecF